MLVGKMKSDSVIALNQTKSLKNSASMLGMINNVGAGSTNHGINSTCQTIYSSALEVFATYANLGESDAGSIVAVDHLLAELDGGMRAKM